MGILQKARSHYRFHDNLLYCDYAYVFIINFLPLAISKYYDKVLSHCFPKIENTEKPIHEWMIKCDPNVTTAPFQATRCLPRGRESPNKDPKALLGYQERVETREISGVRSSSSRGCCTYLHIPFPCPS